MREDLRYAIRRLLHARLFSIAVIVILAAGMTVATAMGNILNALAYKQLELPDASALVAVSSLDQRGAPRNTPLQAIEHLRRATLSATGWCGYNTTLDATESAQRVLESFGEMVAGDCLDVIGVRPVQGRWFRNEEAPLSGSGLPVMVITDGYWSKMFDRRPDVIGQIVKIQDVRMAVIGVMPPMFSGFSTDIAVDFVIPFNAHRASSGASRFIGRLTPGATVDHLSSQVRSLWPGVLDSIWPAGPTREQLLPELRGGAERVSRGFSILSRLYVSTVKQLTVVAAVVLLLVAINVGGLMFSRVAARSHEIDAMRALGASSMRIARPLLFECVVLALVGAAIGVPIAFAASTAFAHLLPIGNLPWTMNTRPDSWILATAAVATLCVVVVIAILPIGLAVRRTPQLRGDRSVSRSTNAWAKGLLVTQVAVTVMLVFTSSLLVRSFSALRSADRGYDREHLLSLRLAANPGGYQRLDAPAYYKALIDEVSAVPGVEAAGMARYFGTINAVMSGQPVGFVGDAEGAATAANDFVSPGFFGAVGVPILRGRDIAWSDLPSTTTVGVISDSLARALSRDGDVVGRMITFGAGPTRTQLQIVGVVGNLSMGNVRDTTVRMIYQSSLQMKQTPFATIHIRTAGRPMSLGSATTNAVARLGREHALGAYANDVLFINSMVPEQMASIVTSAAAMFALAISCVGLFALLSHSVQRRTREIGIRVAIGATPAAVSQIVIGDAIRLVIAGLIVGVPAAIGATRFIRSLLFNTSTTDTATAVISVGVLMLTAMIAAAQPAWRAMRVDAAESLRSE